MLHRPRLRLGDLATHTSGLRLERLRPIRHLLRTSPFRHMTIDGEWLSNQKLLTPAGSAALYSNVAFDFLGDVLTKATGQEL